MEHDQKAQVVLARAVLLFFSAGPWTPEHQRRWKELTGQDNATTKVLGDLAREVLDIKNLK
jgi:hypothetical protein